MKRQYKMTKLIDRNLGSRHYYNAWELAYQAGLTGKVMSIKPVSNYIKGVTN